MRSFNLIGMPRQSTGTTCTLWSIGSFNLFGDASSVDLDHVDASAWFSLYATCNPLYWHKLAQKTFYGLFHINFQQKISKNPNFTQKISTQTSELTNDRRSKLLRNLTQKFGRENCLIRSGKGLEMMQLRSNICYEFSEQYQLGAIMKFKPVICLNINRSFNLL